MILFIKVGKEIPFGSISSLILKIFTDFPGYGFTTFMSKKEMERSIFTMLYENDVVEDIDEMDERNPERVKIVKTIRQFLNFILPKK